MKTPRINRTVLRGILSGTYSPQEFHEFVQLCYALALPLIRKKIALGKINLAFMRLREADIVQDCLADLFRREDSTVFPEISKFFSSRLPDLDNASDERILMTLRQLVLGKCNNNLVRLYAEADPVLGKVFRNVTLAIDRTKLFEKSTRFGEACLIVRGQDPLLHLSPMPVDCLRERFSSMVLVHDTIPQMMTKLHTLLSQQAEHQRAVPLVAAALLFKEVYALSWDEQQASPEQQGEAQDVQRIIDNVCRALERQMHASYVDTGKRTAEVFGFYMLALQDVLVGVFVNGEADSISYFDHLKQHMPRLTKTNYAQQHRTVFEYMAKTAKERVRKELQNM